MANTPTTAASTTDGQSTGSRRTWASASRICPPARGTASAGRSSDTRMASTAVSTPPNDTALRAKHTPVPHRAMTTAATAGPAMRAMLKVAPPMATALGTWSSGTISGTKAWRTGKSTTDTRPWASVRA
jgi:hypothetical protein